MTFTRRPLPQQNRGRAGSVLIVDPLAAYSPSLSVDLREGVTLSGGDVASLAPTAGATYGLDQADTSADPVYEATGWGGSLPSMQFDGVGEWMYSNTFATTLAGEDHPYTIAMAMQNVAGGVYYSVWALSNSSGGLPGSDMFNIYSNVWWSDRRGASASYGASDTNRHIFIHRMNGTTLDVWKDGVKVADGAAYDGLTLDAVRFYVAALFDGTDPPMTWCNLRLSKMAGWPSALSDADVAAVHTIFNTAYPVS